MKAEALFALRDKLEGGIDAVNRAESILACEREGCKEVYNV